MARLHDVWFTPGEIRDALTFGRSGIQKILKKLEKEGLIERWNSPSVSFPPSIASLPPTYGITGSKQLAKRRTVSSRQGEKPYRILADGERLCNLVKIIEKIGLPTGLQKTSLASDKDFMAKLKAIGYNETDLEKAEKAGILDHRRVKVTEKLHETTFGVATERSIADAFQPRIRKTQIVVRHRYRIA
jgi:hypothetical protein